MPRQKSPTSKVLISLRLDPDVIAHFRVTGDGWQARMNEQLRLALTGAALVPKPPAAQTAKPRPTPTPTPTPASAALPDVQIGPTRPKFGALLSKGKRP